VFGLGLLRWGLTALCCVPAATFVAEVLVGAPPPKRRQPARPGSAPPRTVVLVPAHNEQAVIRATLDNLRGELDAHTELLVIADNCEDATPEIAEAAGARVVRRVDPSRRGKGYAIEFGLAELAKEPPEIVVIVDADCRVERAAFPCSLRARGRRGARCKPSISSSPRVSSRAPRSTPSRS